MKLALITGISGQDGAYLANFLLKKKYRVVGLDRRLSKNENIRLDYFGITNKIIIEYADLLNEASLSKIFKKYDFDEVYNLAAQSFVASSFDVPLLTSDINSFGTIRLLEIIKNLKKKVKFYQASTSEMFGDAVETPQTEKTPFNPVSPYATSKLFSYYISKNFREAFGMFVCNGILFNHESPLRGEEFVTKKIANNFKKIQDGSLECFYLGNIYSKRDWGFAGDYVEAMWKMMQRKKGEDYVISTGEQYSVKDFVNIASKFFGFNLAWRGKGLDEVAFDKINKRVLIRIDKKLYRPNEVKKLVGDYSKARKELNWKPKVKFNALVEMMCNYESKIPNTKKNNYISSSSIK